MLLFLQIERKVQICMKKSLAIYLSMLALVLTSCFDDVDDSVSSPYALLKSFGIGNITCEYPVFASDGADSTEIRTLQGASCLFSINQVTGDVYNADSLPFATRVDKVVVSMQLSGYAQIYVDSTDTFENFLSTDSLDFTTPRKFRITSGDDEYYKDYTVSVNVHQVDPERMAWDVYEPLDSVSTPLRVLEFNNRMCLFTEKEEQLMFAESSLTGEPSWSEACPLEGLPADAAVATIQRFGNSLYLAAADGVYVSADAKKWSLCYAVDVALAIVGASDDDRMWVATTDSLFSTTDGVSYVNEGALPAGFPVYGVSIASYKLNHNSDILRYMLVGYADKEMQGKSSVWSRLSTEKVWTKYENENNAFSSPSLKGLTVMRYDNSLYAIGGAGVAQSENVGAFSSFYISRDNGITWKAPEGFYQRIPADLKGNDAPFVATVDSGNVMWIVCAGNNPVVCKGIINRLGFKN